MRKISTLFLFFFIMSITACTQKGSHHLRIALSSASDNYINWIHRSDSSVVIIDLKGLPADSAISQLTTCNGIVFTGGEDVVPSYYGKTADTARCRSNPARDSLEFVLVRKALKMKLPVLGICRGQQLLNVAMKGTLLIDIPTDYPSEVAHRCDDYLKCYHHVKVENGTLLREVCKSDTGWVTSNHHQAIEKLGEDIRVSAYSSDGLPEAIEWIDPKDKGYFMAVQWHPERMEKGNPLSDPLVRAFLQAAIIYKVLK